MRRALTTFVVIAFVLTGCSNADDDVKDTTNDAIEIQIDGDNISPKGDRVEVKTGETITLEIDSDRAGELHVHSTPEQELSFDEGVSTVELTIETPGIAEVEEHETGVVVLQLEVN